MTSWVRLWRDMPTDPKFRAVARKSGRPLAEVISLFVVMMTSADDDGNLVGWCHEDSAAALDMDVGHVEAIHSAMQGKVLAGDTLTGWSRRQPKREDDSKERVRAHRERKKQKGNGLAEPCNADVTHGNAPESESESESEGITVRPESDAARETVGRTAAFPDLKNRFNGATEAMLALVDGAMGPGDNRANSEQWLASTVAAHGAQAVAQAFAIIVEKRARGEIVSRVLAHWSKLAGSLRGVASTQRAPPGSMRSDGQISAYEIIQRRKAASAEALA